MSSFRLYTLLATSGLLIVSLSAVTEAQIVRRFGGGGVQVRAPFVRVNVGPYGGTSVRAPFVAVDSPGRTYVGRRRRLMAQPRYAAPPRNVVRGAQRSPKPLAPTPDTADVDALPYPTASALAAMEDAVLVETMRKMMARLHYRLSRLKTGEGWQNYLVLNREILGSPGAPPETVQLDAVKKMLPRYRSVQDDPQFAKIAGLPSFVATFAALQETNRRFGNSVGRPVTSGPDISDPNIRGKSAPAETTTVEEPIELLPTPESVEMPNASRGERSILKRK